MTEGLFSRPADEERLFSGAVHDEVARAPGDEAALIQTMRLAVAADGTINEREMATLTALSHAVPQLRGKEPAAIAALLRLPVDAAEYARRVGRSSPALRAQCFAIAVDLALASGDRAEALDRTIASLRAALQIAPDAAAATIRALALKYGRLRPVGVEQAMAADAAS